MNKVTTAALAGLVAVTASAQASVSRWNGFGDANAYIADVQDIFSGLPGVVVANKNASYMEFGKVRTASGWGTYNVDTDLLNNVPNNPGQNATDPAAAWGGVHSELGPGVLGIWVNRPTNSDVSGLFSGLGANFGGNSANGSIVDGLLSTSIGGSTNAANIYAGAPAAGRVDLLYGFGISDKLDLGISLSRANRNAKSEAGGASQAYDANALGFGLGAEIKELGIIKLLEVGVTVDTDGFLVSNKAATEDKFSAGATVFGLRVGGDIAGDEGKFGRFEVGLRSGSANAKNEPNAAPAAGNKEQTIGGMKWNLGYALGKSGDKGMGLMGLMLKGSSMSSKMDTGPEAKQGDLALQLTTAGEAKVKEWLTARAGLASNLFQTQSSDTGAGTTTSGSNNGGATLSTGLSMNFGALTIDGVLNQDVLYTNGFLVSGIGEALYTQVSATWGW